MTKYIKHIPTPKQQAFLLLDCRDAFYGGAGGGGKSDALLMAALQYVDVPGYSAILIRDSYANLTKPEALMMRAHDWLQGTDARWDAESKKYTFPTAGSEPAYLSFGYLDGPMDHFNYQSAAFQFVGIDEAVQIRENQALYMFARLRRLKSHSHIPIRFRCASNPPAIEQIARGEWVKRRYVDPETRGDKVFIPAYMEDNPYLDIVEYKISLNELDPVTRAQIRDGDWVIRASGRMFKREWFRIVYDFDIAAKRVRFWDMAATEPLKKGHEPAWTVGTRMALNKDKILCIEDVRRFRKNPADTEKIVKQTAQIDGKAVDIEMEQEGGSAGKTVIDHYLREVLLGYTFKGQTVSGSKVQRAKPLSSYAEAGNVCLLAAEWNKEWLDEMEFFPDSKFKDQADSASGGYNHLCGTKNKPCLAWV